MSQEAVTLPAFGDSRTGPASALSTALPSALPELKQGDPQSALAAANIASGRQSAGDEEPAHAPNVVPITSDDYFARNPEFSVWVRDTRHKYFR